MSEDFLKKIGNKKQNEDSNPFDKMFQQKKEETKLTFAPPVKPKKDNEPESIDGIENLGKSPTSKDRYNETAVTENVERESFIIKEEKTEKTVITKEEAFGELEIEEAPKGLSSEEKIPAKSMENADIFSTKDGGGNFLGSSNSSVQDLSFDDDSSSSVSPYDEKLIEMISSLLKQNKPDEAIKLISANKKQA